MNVNLSGARIVILSRCSWTLFNFRRALMCAAGEAGASVTGMGAGGDGYDTRLVESGLKFQSVALSKRSLNPVADLRLVWELRRVFRQLRPTLVHSFTIKPAIFGTLAAAAAGVPVRVVTITGLGYAFASASSSLRRVVIWLYRVALRFAHLVVFQNAEDRRLFIDLGIVPEEKCRLVAGSGVDTSRFAVAPLPGNSAAVLTFLMVSRLLKEKGVMEYAAAARLVKTMHPLARFRLLGAEDSRNPTALSAEEIKSLADAAIEYLPEVADVRPIIAEADVIVLPSYREGLPRSLLEGAAMGRALIATDTTGCRDVVEHGVNGYLVPVADATALAAAMGDLLEHRERVAAMGARARALVEEKFEERVVIESTLADYDSLLRRSS